MSGMKYVKHTSWQPTGPWKKVSIKSKMGGSIVFEREEIELADDKVYILKDGHRYRWAGLDRCHFYSEVATDIFPKDMIPELN